MDFMGHRRKVQEVQVIFRGNHLPVGSISLVTRKNPIPKVDGWFFKPKDE